MKLFNLKLRTRPRGQSFIELALVLTALIIMVSGVVELGNLINQYLDLIDAAREGARFANSVSFYRMVGTPPVKDYSSDVYDLTAQTTWATMNPACQGVLPKRVDGDPTWPCLPNTYPHPANEKSAMGVPFDPATDEIYISIIAVNGGSVKRFPEFTGGWNRFDNGYSSAVSDTEILTHIDPTAPKTAFVLVEIFYNYHQLLGLPILSDILPDPIPVHVYSIMPYPGAEPTPTPLP